MTTYAVYEHKVLGRKAVKNGFSAGGLFFPIIWSLMNKIWWLAAVLFAWGTIAASMDSVLSNGGGHGAAGALIAQFMFYHIPAGIIFGFAGNGILRSTLENKGYSKLHDLKARSPEDALAKSADPRAAGVLASLSSSPADLSAQLSKLNELRQSGALSEEEYQSAKSKLLT